MTHLAKNLLGVMQGRLSKKVDGKYQAHPVGCWEPEFYTAKELGLDCIEFIYDFDGAEANPLVHKEGIEAILAVSKSTGVRVETICADYFMEAPLHDRDPLKTDKNIDTLLHLVESSSKIGVSAIVLPCVDQASLATDQHAKRLCDVLKLVMSEFEKHSIFLSLETDLAPSPFAKLIEEVGSDKLTINYDIGNSASLNYDPVQEFAAYGQYITDVHIKDRKFGGGPVILGQGDADFELCCSELQKLDYSGPLIMQAYRDDEGVEIFKQQLDWIKSKWEVLFAR